MAVFVPSFVDSGQVLHNLKLATHMQTDTHRPRQHGNFKCLPYFAFRKESRLKMFCTQITLKKTRIILLLTRITSFHVYVLERYDICMVRCDAQHE